MNKEQRNMLAILLVWLALNQINSISQQHLINKYMKVCNDTLDENQKSVFNISQLAREQIFLPYVEESLNKYDNI